MDALIMMNPPMMPEEAPPWSLLFYENNELAKSVILRSGAMRIMPKPVPRGKGGAMVVALYRSHPTHWLICARFEGYGLPEQNGWMAVAEPKSLTDAKGALARAHSIWKRTCAIPYRFVEVEEKPPES